jgi:adenylate cyclase
LNAVSSNGTTVHLEPKVMEVLVCLAQHAGEPVSKEQLLQAVWPNTFVTDDVLKRSISELRRVFEDDVRESRIIQTIPKRGYRLLVPVETVNRDSSR